MTRRPRAKTKTKTTRSLLRYKVESEAGTIDQKIRALLKDKKKDKALFLLKIKKMKEKQLKESQDAMLNLEQMIGSIETEQQQVEVFAAMKEGTSELQRIHEIMSVEAVEKLMEENQEALDTQEEISELLAGSAVAADIEAEAEAELAQLDLDEANEIGQQLPVAPKGEPQVGGGVQDMPEAPSGEVKVGEGKAAGAQKEKRQAVLA